jgi:hypothetical protein
MKYFTKSAHLNGLNVIENALSLKPIEIRL